MHKEKHYARHFGERDQKSDKCIRTREYPVEVDRRNEIGQDRADNEHGKYSEIARNAYMLFVILVLVVFVFVFISHFVSRR